MLNIIEKAGRFLRRTQSAAAAACSDDYLRGYLQGLRRHHREGRSVNDDEHAQWLGFADSPALPDLERGYRDGLAGIEPQPQAPSPRRTSDGTRWGFKAG
jgi:hypothetical protein